MFRNKTMGNNRYVAKQKQKKHTQIKQNQTTTNKQTNLNTLKAPL